MANTIKIKGIKKVSGNTKDYGYSGRYEEVFFDKATGEIWSISQWSLGQNSWTEYYDTNIVKLVNATRHYTMAELREMCEAALAN